MIRKLYAFPSQYSINLYRSYNLMRSFDKGLLLAEYDFKHVHFLVAVILKLLELDVLFALHDVEHV